MSQAHSRTEKVAIRPGVVIQPDGVVEDRELERKMWQSQVTVTSEEATETGETADFQVLYFWFYFSFFLKLF